MTDVYGDKHTYKFPEVRARNVNDKGTRYNPCSRPKYGEVLGLGRYTLEQYLAVKAVEKKAKEMQSSGDAEQEEVKKRVVDARWTRALEQGPLMQK
jgi:hypothetical protein